MTTYRHPVSDHDDISRMNLADRKAELSRLVAELDSLGLKAIDVPRIRSLVERWDALMYRHLEATSNVWRVTPGQRGVLSDETDPSGT